MRSKSTMKAHIIGVVTILASGIGAQSAAARWTPPSIDPSTIIRNSASFQLRSNTTETFTLRPQGLGVASNTLMSCSGFSVHGPGVSIDDAEPNAFGPVEAPVDEVIGPDGQVLRRIMPVDPIIPQAERQPDGTYAIPDRAAMILADDNVGGRGLSWAKGCAASDWHAYDDAGHPTAAIMPHYPDSASGTAARKSKKAKKVKKASKSKARRHARRVKAHKHSAKARVAAGDEIATRTVTSSDPGVGLPAPGTVLGPEQEHVVIDSHSGPVTVELAGWYTVDRRLVVRITTGKLLGPTTLGLHGDVLRQGTVRTNVPEND